MEGLVEIFQGKTNEIVWFVFWSSLMLILSIGCRIFRKRQMDMIGKRNLFLIFSGILILISIWSLTSKGLHFGLDFTGGTLLEFGFKEDVTASQVRTVLSTLDPKFTGVQIQAETKNLEQGSYEPKDELKSFIIIRTEFISQENVKKITIAFEEKLGKTTLLRNDSIGPTVGNELKRGAVMAIAVALIIQLLYITFRFGINFRYGLAADIALIHDVVIMVGFYSLTGREVDSPFVAALLTVIGYSVMDSIVIFDRIRENLKKAEKLSFSQLVNASVLQTMTRSINTLLTVLFTLFALYFFGGETLKNFAFALLVGVTCGAYSSIFVASPILVIWDSRQKKQVSTEKANGKNKVSKNGKGYMEEADSKHINEADLEICNSKEKTSHSVTTEQARKAVRIAGTKKLRREKRRKG